MTEVKYNISILIRTKSLNDRASVYLDQTNYVNKQIIENATSAQIGEIVVHLFTHGLDVAIERSQLYPNTVEIYVSARKWK